MAPKQKTFELIPDLPGLAQAQQQRPADAAAAIQSRPPMTTKQAKKLYRQKSKEPKLSKAEQRRIDLMEQDRIRKEFEKEKAQARARTARDKKKAKEDKEKDEKRKKGLPLVNIHPSQDTISRFISRLGFGGKDNTHLASVQEADSESATEVESDADVQNGPLLARQGNHVQDDNGAAPGKENQDPADAVAISAARPAKRRKLGQPGRNLLDRMINIPSQPSIAAVARVAQEMEKDSLSRPSSIDTDDPATEAMLEDQLIADAELASSKSAPRSSPNKRSPSKEPLPSHIQPPSHVPLAPRAPSPPPPLQLGPQPPRPHKFQGRQLPPGARIALGVVAPTDHSRAKSNPVDDPFKKPVLPFVPGGRQGPAVRCTVAAKPPAPPRFKPPAGVGAPRPGGPKFLPKPAKAAPTPLPVQASPTYAGSRRPAIKTADAFPTSTQLLVINHVDELFPSPSQEARELHEDQGPARTARFPSSPSSLIHKPPISTDEHVDHQEQPGRNALPEFPFLATQDLVLSSQDMRELDTPSKVQTEPAPRIPHVASHGNPIRSGRNILSPPSNGKPEVVPGATEAMDINSDRCRLLPASHKGLAARGTLPDLTVKEATQCSTPAHIRPRSRCLHGSSGEPRPFRLRSQANTSSPQKRTGKHDGLGQRQSNEGLGCCPPTSQRAHSPAKHSRANSPSGSGSATSRLQKGCAVPPASPPKKRMFGSSGPGAEALIAMERSYKENLVEERRRKEELRAQARKPSPEELAEQDLAEIVQDDLLDDEIDSEDMLAANPDGLPDDFASGDRSPATSGRRSCGGLGTDAEAHATGEASGTRAGPVASQETDYGDFDFGAGELDILADITWADDDLSDI